MTDLRFARTPVLDVGYHASGPDDGAPVVLLHGWPDDATTWHAVAPALAAAGYRCIAPYLRGYGPTRFVDAAARRSGQLAALGVDVVELADAIGLGRFALVGHDWGARAAGIAAALAGERVTHLALLSVGYGTNDPAQSLSIEQSRRYWYQWYMATPRGEREVRENRRAFTRYMWRTWSPSWRFGDEEFDAAARSFDNDDWADIVLHCYRQRWDFAPGDPRYDAVEARLRPAPKLAMPTLMLHGGDDQCTLPSMSEGKEGFFTGRYERRMLAGVGHFPQREDPRAVAAALLEWLGANRANGS